MPQKNYLLGKGERLTEDIEVRSGGGPKEPPYTFGQARARLAPMLSQAISEVYELEDDACPRDQAIISLTIHPEYIAKSYYPRNLLHKTGVEVVGSRPTTITPEKMSRERKPDTSLTTELFARGARSAFCNWGEAFPYWSEFEPYAKDLVKIESISVPSPKDKFKGEFPKTDRSLIEIVLYADEFEFRTMISEEFQKFLSARNIEFEIGRCFFAKGLCFLEVNVTSVSVEEVARFSYVRTLRQMPKLRMIKPTLRSSGLSLERPPPDEPPISSDVRVAIFDGGIPENHFFQKWVNHYEFSGVEPPTEELESHGVAVTSAALFGHIDPQREIPRPYSFIDHYRVLDDAFDSNPFELYEVLERIEHVLSSREYDLVNISIGPELPIEDDEIHAWTAVLDDAFARSSTLATIAVGNGGEGDVTTGLNRVQVPSDCVNALAVGACDSTSDTWKRAPYSSVGPGRSPGLIEPDLVDFGGVNQSPFVVFTSDLAPNYGIDGGTSLAAPCVTRMAAGLRTYFGPRSINLLAIRALLVHTAENRGHDRMEVGWGRIARGIDDIIICSDDTVCVVYQGEISPAKYIRASIPTPQGTIQGMVSIKATICYKSQTDPHHPGNYTQAGLEATFRPHDGRFKKPDQVHPDSKTFFGSPGTGLTEVELRRDAMKWENCLHSSKNMRGQSLRNPCFDIHYISRSEGHSTSHSHKLPYALVVSIQARSVSNLYDQIIRNYATILEPLRPILEVPVQT